MTMFFIGVLMIMLLRILHYAETKWIQAILAVLVAVLAIIGAALYHNPKDLF